MVNLVTSAKRKSRSLLHVFPSFGVGGAQIRFGRLAAAHGDLYKHTVIALDGNYDMAKALPPGVPWERAQLPWFDKLAGLKNVPKLRRYLKLQHPDVLVTYNWGAIEWCLANRWMPVSPHIHIEDGFGHEERDRQLFRRVAMRRIALSGRHTRVIVPSHLLEKIALHKWRLRRRSVLYVPNGVDCVRFNGDNQSNDNAGHRPIVIGTVAALRPEKRIDRLIELFAAVAAAMPCVALELLIVGDGPERQMLEGLALGSGCGQKIRFAGATSIPEQHYREMDIFALTSDTEQMPLSILEAMASCLPIVSTSVGDVIDMVAQENRPFVVNRNAEANLRTCLQSLVDNPNLRTSLGQLNRKVATALFDNDAMIARYAQLFG